MRTKHYIVNWSAVFITPFLKKIRLSFICILVIAFGFIQSGCKKLVEVDAPYTSINTANIYKSDATAIAVLTGVYTNMSNADFSNGGISSASLFPGLSADELTLYTGVTSDTYVRYYTNALSTNPTLTADYWNSSYPIIFVLNSAIEGLNGSNSLTPAVKQQLLGEAKFMRGFFYFYLVNFYGDVPLVLTTDYTTNATLARKPKSQVYQQIIADLKDAQNLLSSNYLSSNLLTTTSEKIRPTSWAATALLARVYLYYGNLINDQKQYLNAETEASIVINNPSYSLSSLSGSNSVFLKNSSEAIWQLQPVQIGYNTPDALLFVIPSTGPSSGLNPVYLSTTLMNSFEPTDQRKVIGNWIDSVTVGSTTYYYPYKYKSATLDASVTEYEMILRLAEQYLIRSEARALQDNIVGAQADLNAIRNRAGLPNTNANDKPSLLDAILHERQVELFTEWGHRWLDIKRTRNVDIIMTNQSPLKGGVWNSYQQLYPIPLNEIQKDVNLSQNPGY